MTWLSIALVGIGGFFGAIARFAISRSLRDFTTSFPLGTLFVNIMGSFALGVVVGMEPQETVGLLIGIGLLGAFTTFSTFKLEVVQLYRHNQRWLSFTYVFVTYGFGFAVALLGYAIGFRIT